MFSGLTKVCPQTMYTTSWGTVMAHIISARHAGFREDLAKDSSETAPQEEGRNSHHYKLSNQLQLSFCSLGQQLL